MSFHQAFRRTPAPSQVQQKSAPYIIPAPTRGIVQSENYTFMQPGASIIQDNWVSTMRGVKLRGGYVRWCDLHVYPNWSNNTAYTVGTKVFDTNLASSWQCAVAHTSAAAGTFAADRAAHPTYWTETVSLPLGDPLRKPIISGFEYLSANLQKMFAANATTLFDVSATTPITVKTGQHSGNYAASQMANASGDYMIVVNDAGDAPLRFNGTTWATLDGTPPVAWSNSVSYVVGNRAMDTTDRSYWKCTANHTSAPSGTFAADRAAHPSYWAIDVASDGMTWIVGPPGSNVVGGGNLIHVWKYRNRLFFIELNSMNAWYLPLNAVGGALSQIPLSGAVTKGGTLLFGSTWSIDAGDGIDDKCVFFTTEGEAIVFTGSNPADAANWRQEGRYAVSPPMGMNAHTQLGGDLLIATIDGIIPLSQAINKTKEQLDLAAITRTIKPLWRDDVNNNGDWPWTIKKWDEYGGMFVSTPGDPPGKRHCWVANSATTAWCRFLGYDATCFMYIRGDFFFGTQDGIVMQADRTGYDDGKPYVATLVGGWEMFQAPPATVVWRQARAVFTAGTRDPFIPQLAACTDYQVRIPHPPPAGADLGVDDVWDQGLWDVALWDQASSTQPAIRNTGWVSIGETGFSHAPVVQTTVAQQARPNVELISIAAMYERVGINV